MQGCFTDTIQKVPNNPPMKWQGRWSNENYKNKEELKEAISVNSLIDNFQYWIQICHNVGDKVSRTTFQTTNMLFQKNIKQRNFHYCLFLRTIIIFINKIRKIPENGKIIQKYCLLIFKLNLVLFGLNAISLISKSEIIQIT